MNDWYTDWNAIGNDVTISPAEAVQLRRRLAKEMRTRQPVVLPAASANWVIRNGQSFEAMPGGDIAVHLPKTAIRNPDTAAWLDSVNARMRAAEG